MHEPYPYRPSGSVTIRDVKNALIVATLTSTLIGLSACSPKTDAGPASAAVAPSPAAAAEAALKLESSHASTAPALPETVTGPVLETMDAASYTYVRVKGPAGDIWAATSQFKVAVGDVVVVPIENPMGDFHSQTLKRDFKIIYFVSGIGRPGDKLVLPQTGAPQGGMGTPPAVVPQGPIEVVPPVAGSVTIASVLTNSKSLGGKTVTLRGKVVKYNAAILGSNWVHLQDGSGSAKDGTHDIAITTSGTAKVGDIVTVTGTVVLDKDFGSGYAYAVLIEKATIK